MSQKSVITISRPKLSSSELWNNILIQHSLIPPPLNRSSNVSTIVLIKTSAYQVTFKDITKVFPTTYVSPHYNTNSVDIISSLKQCRYNFHKSLYADAISASFTSLMSWCSYSSSLNWLMVATSVSAASARSCAL